MTKHIKEIQRVERGVKDPRYRFLVRIQAMLIRREGITCWRDGRFFDSQLGKRMIDDFMADGIIPSPWSDTFGKYSEWEKILRIFYKDFVVTEEEKDKSLMEIEKSKGNSTQTQKYISRNQNGIVLSALVLKGGLGGDIGLAEVLGVEMAAIRFMRKGRDLISKKKLRNIVKKLGLLEKDFEKWL